MSEFSTLRKRIMHSRRHEWKIGRLLGVGMLAFASVIILYTIRVVVPKQEKIERQAYRDSTLRLSERLVTGVANLSEWSTDESLESYSKAILVLAERNDVDTSLDDELSERVDTLKETRHTRQIRFDSLLGDVDDFPLVSPVGAVLAFERRMRGATYTLSRKQGEDLMQRWSDRMRQIRFESLLGDVDDFPLDSSVGAVLAFERRMRGTTFTLSRKQGEDLMQRWSDRRDKVVVIRLPAR